MFIPNDLVDNSWSGLSFWPFTFPSLPYCLPQLVNITRWNPWFTMENHHFLEVNQLFLWPFSILFLWFLCNQRNHITGNQPVAQLSFQVSLDPLSAFGNSQTGCLRQGFVVWALGATLLSNENHGNGTKICAKGTYMVAEWGDWCVIIWLRLDLLWIYLQLHGWT